MIAGDFRPWTESRSSPFPRADISSRKRMKIARVVCEDSAGASGEVDLDNGGIDAVILDDPERARLSE
jgi:hypothetical protein